MDIAVFWIIDEETDEIIGSVHTSAVAEAISFEYHDVTDHHAHVRRVMMDEASVRRELPEAV